MALLNQFQQTLIQDQSAILTIPAGQAVSNIFNCGGVQLGGVMYPSNWTSCNISLSVGKTANKMAPLNTIDGVGIFSLPATSAPRVQSFIPYYIYILGVFQLVCNVPQVEEVTVELFLQPIFKGING